MAELTLHVLAWSGQHYHQPLNLHAFRECVSSLESQVNLDKPLGEFLQAASAQVPSVVHAAADKLPRQFGGGNGKDSGDDVAADGNLVYPAEGDASAANGVRYTPDSPGDH